MEHSFVEEIFEQCSQVSPDIVHKNIILLGIITVGLFTTGKNKNREKYGGISPNPTIFIIQIQVKVGINMTGKNKNR